MSEIVVFNQTKADLAVYKEENARLAFDYEDPQGNKAARSQVYKIKKAKGSFDKLRKETKADALAACKNIDAAAKLIMVEFDEMIAVHQDPIKRIEDREEAEKQAALDKIREDREKEEAARLADLVTKEKELEELKANALAAENLIKAKEAAAKAEIDRAAREKKIAEDAKKEAEEKAERDLKAAEEKRLADIAAAEARVKEEAAAKERVREDIEAKRLADEQEKYKLEAVRVADVEHRIKIEGEVAEGIAEVLSSEDPGDDEQLIVEAIKEGKIPHLTINY